MVTRGRGNGCAVFYPALRSPITDRTWGLFLKSSETFRANFGPISGRGNVCQVSYDPHSYEHVILTSY